MKTARDIMTRDVVTVKKNQPISDLSKLFIENHFNGVPVLDDEEKVVGTFSIEKNFLSLLKKNVSSWQPKKRSSEDIFNLLRRYAEKT